MTLRDTFTIQGARLSLSNAEYTVLAQGQGESSASGVMFFRSKRASAIQNPSQGYLTSADKHYSSLPDIVRPRHQDLRKDQQGVSCRYLPRKYHVNQLTADRC